MVCFNAREAGSYHQLKQLLNETGGQGNMANCSLYALMLEQNQVFLSKIILIN